MFQLKPISKESIPAAIEKAERYRLLDEPNLAESICLDILEADPQNAKAIIILLLAITDQFGSFFIRRCEPGTPASCRGFKAIMKKITMPVL